MKKLLLLTLPVLFLISCGKEVDSNFTMDKTEIMAGESVQFTNTSLEAFYFHWKFGDGEESRLENPLHRFMKAGEYDVLLHVTNNGGDMWSNCYQSIRVNGYNIAFVRQWIVTDDVVTDSCGTGIEIYNLNIINGENADEVMLENFADRFNEPVKGRSPYGDPNKIEINETHQQAKNGDYYDIVGTIVISGPGLDISYTLNPSSSPSLCGHAYGDGVGVHF